MKKGQQNELVGKIILANFLEYPMSKFLKYIHTVENQPIYIKLVDEGVVIRKPFSIGNFQSADGVIAKIKKDANRDFSIQYAIEEFSGTFRLQKDGYRRRRIFIRFLLKFLAIPRYVTM